MPSIHSLRPDIVTLLHQIDELTGHFLMCLRAGVDFLPRQPGSGGAELSTANEPGPTRRSSPCAGRPSDRRTGTGTTACRPRRSSPRPWDRTARPSGRTARKTGRPWWPASPLFPALMINVCHAQVQDLRTALAAAGGVGELQRLFEVDADRADLRPAAPPGRGADVPYPGFIVSSITNFGPLSWSSTALCVCGAQLPSRT